MTRGVRGVAREELKADLRARYEAGATIRQLCAATGKSYGAVRVLLDQSGAVMRKHTEPGEPADVLALLHLVDRAADGRLLPGEARLLRNGIRALAREARDGA